MSRIVIGVSSFIVGMITSVLLVATVPFIGEKSRVKSISLPEKAERVSGCMPEKGEQWARPDDLPRGPIYMVADDAVIGVKYTLRQNALEEATSTSGEEGGEAAGVIPMPGVTFHHARVTRDTEEDESDPHYNMYMYLIDRAAREDICPQKGKNE